MKLSALIAPLIAAKAPHDQIMAVVQAYEQQQDDALAKRRAADADRQNRKRERDKSRDVTLRHSDRPLVRDRVAPAEDNQTNNNQPSSKQNTAARDLADFKSALASLGVDRVEALAKLRRTKKAPLTGYAAQLFIKAAGNCSLSLDAAADMCIERNWLTVKPEWLQPQSRGSPLRPVSAEPRNISEASRAAVAHLLEVENGSERDQNGDGPGQNVRYLTASGR